MIGSSPFYFLDVLGPGSLSFFEPEAPYLSLKITLTWVPLVGWGENWLRDVGCIRQSTILMPFHTCCLGARASH